MKFILDEKFILNEKYILLEAEDAINKTDTINQVSAVQTSTKNLIDSLMGLSELEKHIQTNQKDIKKALNAIQAFQELIRVNQVWNTKQEVFKETENFVKAETLLINTFEEIIPQLAQIDKINKSSKFDEAEAKYRVSNIRKLLSDISKEVKALKDKSQTTEREKAVERIQKYLFDLETFVNQAHLNVWFNTLIENIEIYNLIEDNLDEDTKLDNQLKKYLTFEEFLNSLPSNYQTQFKSVYTDTVVPLFKDYEKELLNYLDFDVFIKQPNAKKIKSTLNKLLDIIKELNAAMFEVNDRLERWSIEAEELQKAAVGKYSKKRVTDWAREFDNALQQDTSRAAGADSAYINSNGTKAVSAVEQTWLNYYENEWAGYEVETLQKIGSPLQKELMSLGFHETKNPFISFLRTVLKDEKIKTAFEKKPATYACVHNAFIDNIVSEEDLRGIGLLGPSNIIFNPNLYTKQLADIQKYLQLQATVIHIFVKANNAPKFTDYVPAEDGKHPTPSMLKEKYSNKLTEFSVDLFCKPGNVVDASLHRIEGKADNDLYAVDWIEKNLKLCFDTEVVQEAESDVSKTFSVKDIKSINTAIIKKLVTDIKAKTKKETSSVTTEKALRKKIVKALLISNKIIPSISDYDKKYALGKIVLSSAEADEIIKKYFADYNINELFTDSAKENIFKKLVDELGDGLEPPVRKKTTTGESN